MSPEIHLQEAHLKERIIENAWDRFRTDGFVRVSVDEIASALAMSKKTFYKVFESKEQLVEHIVERMMGEIATQLDRIARADTSFVNKLGELLGYMATVPSRVGFPLMQDIQRHLPQLWKRVEQFRAERINETFGRLLEQGISENYIRPDLNKRLFLLAYLATVQQVMQPAVLSNESFSARDAAQGIMEIFFAGAFTERGRKEFASLRAHISSSTV